MRVKIKFRTRDDWMEICSLSCLRSSCLLEEKRKREKIFECMEDERMKE
jgi:hypothetical protein